MYAAAAVGTGLPTQKFNAWATEHGKSYGAAGERQAALAAFAENDRIIAETNGHNLSYWLGHNQFSDLTLAQFSARSGRDPFPFRQTTSPAT
jgi:hypothetical protein